MDNINEFKIATPAELRKAASYWRSKEGLLDEALRLVKEAFDKNNYSLHWATNNSVIIFLFPDIPNTPRIQKYSFLEIIFNPKFPRKEFDSKLAEFNWRFELSDFDNICCLVEIK